MKDASLYKAAFNSASKINLCLTKRMESPLSSRLQHLLVSLLLCSSLSEGLTKFTAVSSSPSKLSINRGYRVSSSTHRSSVRADPTDSSTKLSSLRKERDIRRDQKLKADLAAQIAEIEYQNFRIYNGHTEGSSFIPGTYDYGFNSQSNDILLVNKNSGLGGSTPVSLLELALTNFKRELGDISSSDECVIIANVVTVNHLLFHLSNFPRKYY